MDFLPAYGLYIIGFIGSVILALIFTPQVIKISGKNMLFDKPDNERKFHNGLIPHLGGTGIFFAYIIPTSILIGRDAIPNWSNIMAAFLLLFITGLIDGLHSLNATKKFAAQLLPAIIICYVADMRLISLYGLLGIYELPYFVSVAFSVVGCMFITNAFNFIDGVDGLAATTGIVMCLALGIFLATAGNIPFALLAFCMVGALVGFLRFNLPPAKIFMGDSGSLPIGFTIAVLCIALVNSHADITGTNALLKSPAAALGMAIALLFIITADSVRVFVARLSKGVSPFRGDRNHIHHYLLDANMPPGAVVATLTGAHVILIGLAYFIQDTDIHIRVGAMLLTFIIGFFIMRSRRVG